MSVFDQNPDPDAIEEPEPYTDAQAADSEGGWKGVYPGMCRDPEICRGKSHCPRTDYSCCE